MSDSAASMCVTGCSNGGLNGLDYYAGGVVYQCIELFALQVCSQSYSAN